MALVLSLATAGGEESGESADGGSDPIETGVLESGVTTATYELDGLVVHTFTNPESGFANTTAVIETDSSVVLIDTHFSASSATAFRSYAESFGKPIERIFITHAHSDHIGGLDEVFEDVTSYSSAGVIAAAAEEGITIDEVVEPGEIEVDGVVFDIEVYFDAEADEQIVIQVPDAGLVASGDLVYAGSHAYLEPNFDNWLAILDELAGSPTATLVVPGHGLPGAPDVVYPDMIDYLGTASSTRDEVDDADSFVAAMVEAYPDRPGVNLLEFGVGNLFR